jgi:O-antigen/teichoic acid export membrane protein
MNNSESKKSNYLYKHLKSIIHSPLLLTVIGVFLRVGSGLLTLPIAIRMLTAEELGLYYTFLSLTGLVMLLDFGFAQSVNRNAAFAMGGAKEFKSSGVSEHDNLKEPNWKLLAELLAAVKIWYRALGLVMLLIMLVPGTLFFIKPLLEKEDISNTYIYCWWLFSTVTALSFVTTYWPNLLYGIGSIKAAARIGIISQGVGTILLVTGLLTRCGLWSYGLATLASLVISFVLAKDAFFKEARQALLHKVDRFRRNAVITSLWPMIWRQGVVMLGAYLIQRGNILTCTQKIGLNETSSYGLSLNIFNVLFQVAVIPLSIVWPTIGKLRVERNFNAILRIFLLRLYLGLIVAAIMIVLIVLFGDSLLKFFGAQCTLLPMTALSLLGAILLLECHHSQYACLVLSENKNPFLWPSLISGIVIFMLSRWAVGLWGIMGMILSQGVVQLLWNNWWTVVRGLRGLK